MACERLMRGCLAMLLLLAVAAATAADGVRLPGASLRAVYLATNPVQAQVERTAGSGDGRVVGPAAELAQAIARELGVPLALRPVPGTADVSAEVKAGTADIGFLAFDPVRAQEVDFSQTYLLAHNSYVVPVDSPIRRVAEADRAGMRIGVGERDAADLFLSRSLREAKLQRFATASLPQTLALLERGGLEAYAANRTRLLEALESRPGLRLLEDNFLSVQQAVVVARGNATLLQAVNRVIDAARREGLITGAIRRAGLRGVDPAPAAPPP